MAAMGLLAIIGGVVPQTADAPAWAVAAGLDNVFRSAPFIVAMLLLLTNLGLATLRRGRALGWRGWLFSLNHAGLWIVLACGMFGAGDVIRARLMLVEGSAEARLVDEQGRQGYLPVGLFLQRFYVEHYPGETDAPGPARSFTAEVSVLHPDGTVEDQRIRVNHPLRRAGWALYLINYELSPDGQTDRCVVEAVRDPWLPGVYAGIFLLLGGAVAMLFRSPFGPNWGTLDALTSGEGRAS
jgi:cytochrome c biogenesis protein ResB